MYLVTKINSLIYRFTYKSKRVIWYFFHPYLWGKVQINGIPVIQVPEKLIIGNHVSLNARVFLQAKGGIRIGNNVTISYGAIILTEGLEIKNYSKECMNHYRKHVCKPVEIGNGVWIGANVTVLPGAKIPKGSVIAAGAIVSGELMTEYALYAGVPAKFVRKLD